MMLLFIQYKNIPVNAVRLNDQFYHKRDTA